jgi:hypothetical protein
VDLLKKICKSFIARSDDTFGGLANFLLANPLDVKMVVRDCSAMEETGNTKGGSITVPLTSCLTGLD